MVSYRLFRTAARLGAAYKTIILIDGKRVKLLGSSGTPWGKAGSALHHRLLRGAQGHYLVYDITNKWSLRDGQVGGPRWRSTPGIPQGVGGNRLLAFKRQVDQGRLRATQIGIMGFMRFPLVNFNIH